MNKSTSQKSPSGLKDSLAIGLGCLSLAVGAAELLFPAAISKLVGVRKRPLLLRLLGLRGIASGIGILAHSRRREDWLWSRVAGDALDLGLLTAALGDRATKLGKLELAAATVASITVVDLFTAREHSPTAREDSAIHFRKTITVNRSPEMVYSFWRNFENLPRFMHNLESVRATGLVHSHWVAKGPAGTVVEWDAVITQDIPNESIAWKSLEGSEVDNWGSVHFEPTLDGAGTIIRVDLAYRPPGGRLAAKVAKLFGKAPEQEVQGDLRRFKEVLETGHLGNDV